MQNNDSRGRWTSASSAEADLKCPGRHLAQVGIESQAGGWAVYGNAIHSALAEENPEGLNLEQYSVYEACQKIEAKVLSDYFGEDAAKAKSRVVREQRYWMAFDNEKYKHSGQPDAVFRLGPKAIITDYKSLGSDIPESPRNFQLRDLACLIWSNESLLDEVAVVLIQPLVTHSPTICVYSKDNIAVATAEMYERIVRSHDPNAPRVAGEKQCQWCLARRSCSAYQSWATSKLPVPQSFTMVPFSQWTPEMWSSFMDGKSTAQKWLDTAYEEAVKLARENPGAVPGYTLKDGAKPRPIIKPEEVFARFEQQGGKLPQFMLSVDVGKTILKAQLSAVTGLRGKKLDDAFEQLLAGCVDETKQNKSSLVKVKGQ